MAGFSSSIQNRFKKPWRPIQQQNNGAKISKKRQAQKQEV